MELFHFDIEVASSYKDFKTFEDKDIRGSNLFRKKFEKMNWIDKYNSIDECYLQQAGIITTYGNICCISFGYINNEGVSTINSYYGEDEKDIVYKFNELLKKVETKNFKLCGFRILYYDIVFILHKLHKYDIKPANILYMYDKKPWESRIVDMSEDYKQKFAYAFSFDEVCYELNIDSPKDKMDGSEVGLKYWEGKYDEIKDYCEKDIKACIDVSKLIYNIKSL